MNDTVIVAIVSLFGTLAGTFGGILTSSKLTNFRLEQLEKKVDKYSNVTERIYKLEQHEAVVDEKIAVANHRIEDLESAAK